MAGRRTKLTEQMAARIVANLRQSGNLENAAAREGVSRSTVYDWMRRGERKSPGPYHGFAHAVTQILEGRIASLATIRKRSAMGCVMEMPAHDKAGRALCGADGNQIFKDKVFRPNRRAIEWKLMLLDRRTYLERKDPWSEEASTETPETETPEAPHKG